MQNIGCAILVLLTTMRLDHNRERLFQQPAGLLLHCWLISANNTVSSSNFPRFQHPSEPDSMRQEKTHQAYCSDDQAGNYDCLKCSKGTLRLPIKWSESRADKSSIAPICFIDSFFHNREQSISWATLVINATSELRTIAADCAERYSSDR